MKHTTKEQTPEIGWIALENPFLGVFLDVDQARKETKLSEFVSVQIYTSSKQKEK